MISNQRSILLLGSGYVGVTDTGSILRNAGDRSCYNAQLDVAARPGARPYHGGVETAGDHEERRALVQATVPALDEDGLNGAMIGTGAFLVAFVVCWIRLDDLRAAGYGDWLWVCLTGAALGLVGIAYILRRRRKMATKD